MAFKIKFFVVVFLLCAFVSNAQQKTNTNTSRLLDSLFAELKQISVSSTADTSEEKLLTKLLTEIGGEYITLREYEKALEYLNKAEKRINKKEDLKPLRQIYNYKGDTYEKENDYENALLYFQKALQINLELNDKQGLEKSYNYIGNTYFFRDQYETALDYLQKSIKLSELSGNKKNQAETSNDIGNVYWHQGNYEKALTHYLKASVLYEALGNKAGIAASYYNIGYVYLYEDNVPKAFEIFTKQLEIAKQIENKSEIGNAYNGLGDTYDKQKDYENAIKYHSKCLELVINEKDSAGISRSYGNIGLAYSHKGDYAQALSNYLNLLKISTLIGDKLGIADAHYYIGEVYLNQSNKEAQSHLHKALGWYEDMGYSEGVKDCYLALAKFYEKNSDHKQAFEYYTKFSDIKDTMFNEQSSKQIMEMSTKYESEKKEKNIELLTKDKALQQAELNRQIFIRNGFIIGLTIAILLAFVIYSRYSTKQKLNIALNSKNLELTQKNNVIEKQKERILDSINYAQRIQQSILMDESEIKKILPQSFVLYLPKDIVSGDFYWCSQKQNKIFIAAIDCTGHGVPGAFMSMIGNTLLNQIINEKHITRPSEILRLLNIGVFEALHQEKDGTLARDGMDIALCCIDLEQKIIEYAGAENPLYIIENNTLTIVKANKQTIGSGGLISKQGEPYKTIYTNHTLQITNGMCIYLFSDGYRDQFGNSDRQKLGTQRFKNLLLSCQQQDMENQKITLLNELKNWQGDMQQTDDIVVIGVKFNC